MDIFLSEIFIFLLRRTGAPDNRPDIGIRFILSNGLSGFNGLNGITAHYHFLRSIHYRWFLWVAAEGKEGKKDSKRYQLQVLVQTNSIHGNTLLNYSYISGTSTSVWRYISLAPFTLG